MTTIDELLGQESQAWAALESAFESVDGDRRNTEDVVPGWSTQVLVWHCAFWADYVAQVVEGAAAGAEAPGDEDWDAINDQVAEDSKAMTWEQVLEGFAAARDRVHAALAALGDERLTEELRAEVVSETSEHFAEHAAEIATFAAQA